MPGDSSEGGVADTQFLLKKVLILQLSELSGLLGFHRLIVQIRSASLRLKL